MTFSKKFKVSLLAVAIISFAQVPAISAAQHFTRSESSMLMSSLVVITVSAIPVVFPIQSSQGASDHSKESGEKDDEFVYLKAQDENGNPVQLKLPKEAQDRVEITEKDRIKLEAGEKGEQVLFVNGTATYLFVNQKDAAILQHKAL